jgi:hypothetical protein
MSQLIRIALQTLRSEKKKIAKLQVVFLNSHPVEPLGNQISSLGMNLAN